MNTTLSALALCFLAGAAFAQAGSDACRGKGGPNACSLSGRAAATLDAPRILSGGVTATGAFSLGPTLTIDLEQPLRRASPPVADVVCGDPALAALIAAGGRVRVQPNVDAPGTITTCEGS